MMKFLNIILLLFPVLLIGQIDLPSASPDASWTHQLGFTQINLSYSRPHMRGRKIFGALVPYNKLWRTGAGESTRIKFSEDISFGGQLVKKGNYALYTIPGQDEWIIILNEDATLHGDFGYDEKKDALRVVVKPVMSDQNYESFQIELTGFTPDYESILKLNWENTEIRITIVSQADDKIMAQIHEQLIANKSDIPSLLNRGAQYYYVHHKDLNQALEWSQNSEIMVSDNLNYSLLTTNLLESLKRYPEAVKSAEKALGLAIKKEKAEEVKRLENMIAEWNKLIKK